MMDLISILLAGILITAAPQESPPSPLPNRPAARALDGLTIPDDPAEALALAARFEAEGRDALGMGFRYAADRFEQALAIRRAVQAPADAAVIEGLRMLAAAYRQQGYSAIAADLLEEASALGTGEGLASSLALARAREGDYSAARAALMASGELGELNAWDATFLEAMIEWQEGDPVLAEERLTAVIDSAPGGNWFDLPMHRFRALTALIDVRQSLGLTAEALEAARSLLVLLGGDGEDSLIEDGLPRREAEQEIGIVAGALLDAGVTADHLGETGEGVLLLEGGLELHKYWPLRNPRYLDGSIRLAEASLALGQSNTALTVAQNLEEEGQRHLAEAVRTRVRGGSLEHGGLFASVAGPVVAWDLEVDAYVLGVAAAIAAAEGRNVEAVALSERAVDLHRARVANESSPDSLDRKIATADLAAALNSLSRAQLGHGQLDAADRSLDEGLGLQIDLWCPVAAGAGPDGGYQWSRDPGSCLGHPALAASVETRGAVESAGQRPRASVRQYRHAGDIALGHTLGRYSGQSDARMEFIHSARFHRAFVSTAWQANDGSDGGTGTTSDPIEP